MAKEIAIGKRAKISEAQQYMLLAVAGAAIVLGIGIAVTLNLIKKISFNARVIAEADKSIVDYSNTIRDIGICPKPKGDVYSVDELKKCTPNTVSISSVPGTLRSNIVENLAANEALNSVPKENNSGCINPETKKNYTYAELTKKYNDASTEEEINNASVLLRQCSALRVIPDALPAFKNEEALLSSLNKIFDISGWEPESLSPGGTGSAVSYGTNLKTFSVRLSVEADSATTMTVIDNIERSIRDFNVTSASIEWNNDKLSFQAQANAYYMDKSELAETTKTIKVEEKKK